MLLIVDDDLDIRESLSDYFVANGFKVMLAENAEGARTALAAHHFEAIIYLEPSIRVSLLSSYSYIIRIIFLNTISFGLITVLS